MVEKNPAKKYILIANNHGGGWQANHDTPLTRAMLYDDNRKGKAISLDQLNEGVRLSGIKFEAIFCDLCLMAYIENLAGYSIQNGGPFKFAIASAEITSGSCIGNLAEQLATKGAGISDDEFLTVLKDWATRSDGKGYMREWGTYSKFKEDPKEECDFQSMGVYDLRNIGSLTDVMAKAADWYTSSYDDAQLKGIIDAAILNSNYVTVPPDETTHYEFYHQRNDYWNMIGLTGSQITEYAVTGRTEEVEEDVLSIPDGKNDFFKETKMVYGITFSHFMRETIERGNAKGLTEKVKPLKAIYDQYLTTLKSISAIKCSHDDFKGMDAYVWTSPTITFFPMNEYYKYDDTIFPVALADKEMHFDLEQCLNSYTHTQFDQKTKWSNFLKKITVSPCVLINPIRSTAAYESLEK